MVQKYKVVSLFSGCGGGDLGIQGGFTFLNKRYKRNPIEFLHASDVDTHCIETYNANFSNPAQLLDIKKINMKNISSDIVVGGFPCQSFSTLNPTKNPYDERAKLYKEMLRIVKQTSPKVVVGENVSGLAVLNNGEFLYQIVQDMEKIGYCVRTQILNAADYGVPQKRKRLFIIGVRNDLKVDFKFPSATCFEHEEPSWIALNNVIDSLIPEDPKYYFSQKAVTGMRNAKNNMKRGLAQDLSSPCLTITSHLAKVSLNSRDPVLLVNKDKSHYRRFTVREAARIQSFPDSFIFPVSDTQAYKQIGNAIPPVVMWHVMQAILKTLRDID